MYGKRKAAFTLIELLVVIAVIAILAAILFPVFARTREKARQAACLSNQHQIAMAVLMYISDYDERFPFVLDYSRNLITNANNGDDPKASPGGGDHYNALNGVTGLEPQFQLVWQMAPYVKNDNLWYCPTVGRDFVWDAYVKIGGWPKGATMRDQGTTYGYDYAAGNSDWSQITFMGGKPLAILRDSSRWPMLWDEPSGFRYTGSLADPPLSTVPHSGGQNVAYGDGHSHFYHLEGGPGNPLGWHLGDGLYPGQ
jgi:prepilin-type N-terminal cleavage/methylation domain-containing protein/prepilin-type processing-associated H-X9-DG protein